MNHPAEYWKGVGMTIEGESRKAGAYITHHLSLGGAREEILRKHLIEETPNRFEAKTGLIRKERGNPIHVSRQCDVLVYEPSFRPPLYRVGEFVVIPEDVARFVVEVKSEIDQREFNAILDVHESILPFGIPTFAYGYDGVTFDTMVQYLQGAVTNNRCNHQPTQLFLNWPVCIAVHSRNYIALRPTRCERSPATYFMLCLDLSRAGDDAEAAATAQFFNAYYTLLTGDHIIDRVLRLTSVNVALPDGACVWITPDGQLHQGPIVLPCS